MAFVPIITPLIIIIRVGISRTSGVVSIRGNASNPRTQMQVCDIS